MLGGDSSKVFIGGFSQGCAMSIYAGVSLPQKLGGIVALSGHLLPTLDLSSVPEERKDIPIFQYHGKSDDVIPEPIG